MLNICICYNDCVFIVIFFSDGNYDMSYFNVSLERSLSRHKRASTLSPLIEIAHFFRIDYANSLIKTILNFIDFIIGLLTGQEGLCPTEKLSIDLIGEMILHPIQITETILCYIFNIIGREKRAITHRLFNTFSDFLRTIFLPGLHTMLNQIAETGILPSSLRTLVEMFNVFYNVLRLVGYIK